MEIKKLPEQFTGRGEVRGFLFTRERETGNAYVYKATGGDTRTHYEVFLKVVLINRFTGELYEQYPSAQRFGESAFTATSVGQIEKILERLATRKVKLPELIAQ